jgi:SAM-dependent methyltransferase
VSEDVTLFTEVDRIGDPDFFIRFLDQGNAISDIQKSKPIILEGLHLRPGLHVLDLGCGTGADALDIAQRVGPSGAVTGVDAPQARAFPSPSRWVTRPNSGSPRTRSMRAGRKGC